MKNITSHEMKGNEWTTKERTMTDNTRKERNTRKGKQRNGNTNKCNDMK